MYTITKRMEIAGSHSLKLPYESPCTRQHGHNWIITVEVSSQFLNPDGMIFDFALIKNKVKDLLDHKNINEAMGFLNPTAENIAYFLCVVLNTLMNKMTEKEKEGRNKNEEIKTPCLFAPYISKITIQESEGNTACYIP